MKKFLLAAMSATLVATPILAAPAEAQQRYGEERGRDHQNDRGDYRRDDRRDDRRQDDRRDHRDAGQRQSYRDGWRKGERFDRRQARNYREVSNWRAYQGRRLYAPPRGYHWVQSGNDALLIALSSGVIGAVIGGAFR